MLKPLSCVFVLVACCHSGLAQNSGPDSLGYLLQQAPTDSAKVELYYKAGSNIIYQDPQGSLKYFKQGALLASSINFLSGAERCYNGCYLAFSINAKYDSALHYINIAIHYAIKAKMIKRLTLVYLNRADVNRILMNYTAALKDCDTSIQYAEQMPDNADPLGRINGIISGIYFEQGKFKETEMYIDRSLGYFARTRNRRMIALMNSDKADLYTRMDQPARSVPLLIESIRIGDSLSDFENLSSFYLSLTETYTKLKRYADAKEAAKNCIRYCEQTENTTQKANAYLALSEIAEKDKDIKGAVSYGEMAYGIFRKEDDSLSLPGAAKQLSEAYLAAGDAPNAYKYLAISSQLNDSLTRKTFDRETAKLQTTFELKEKDKEIQLLNKEKELQDQRLQKQFLLLLGAIALALLAIAGTWLLMNRNKLRQRMKELELRNRIAADLHDEVGSSLSSIHMLSQMASSQKTNEASHRDLLTRMSANAKETMDKMGDIVWMIKPGEAEAGSLKQRMERFAYELGSGKNMEVQVQLEELEKVKLNMEQRRNIYLIFKEAINNAAKYSGARKIAIGASVENSELQLTVKDEGAGFDNQKIKKGNGLGNMMNRAAELGGKLAIGSVPGQGTSIVLTMPL